MRFTRDVNFETRTMETEVDVENRDLAISPGMYANTVLRLQHVENAVTIPVEAIVLEGDKHLVYAIDRSNHVRMREVRIGLEGSKLAEVQAGLQVGDCVIIGGQDKYHEGDSVVPAIASTPASETVQQTGGMIDLKSEGDAH